MSKIQVFKPEHLEQMELRPSEKARLKADPTAKNKIMALAQHGTGGTLFRGDKIIASFGYYEMWPRVFEVWAFPSVHVKDFPMLYLRTVKRYVRAIESTLDPQRLQTTSIADELHNRWMEFLEFTNETPDGMKQYSVLGQTFNLWAKVYED